jgi:hypothetical protein
MMTSRTWVRFALILTAVLALPAMARAQAAISGVVTDESGGALPGVTVEASSPALIEKTRTVITDGEGLYRLVDLRPGVYTVTFTLPGFATLVRDQITLSGTATVTVNGQLKVGALEETLTVTGEAPMVDTTSAAREQVVDRELLDALPTGRQMWTVAVTLPGVSLNGQDVGGAGGLQQTRMRAFGAVEQEVTIEVDGILMNSVHGGGSTQQYFNDGMVQEMSVATGALDAETQTGGVRLNMIPQTGGNVFSGSVVAVSVPSPSFQSDNLSDELRNATCGPTNAPCGLTSVNGVDIDRRLQRVGGRPDHARQALVLRVIAHPGRGHHLAERDVPREEPYLRAVRAPHDPAESGAQGDRLLRAEQEDEERAVARRRHRVRGGQPAHGQADV